MHIPSFLFSGLLLLGAGLARAENTQDNEVLCNGNSPEMGTKDFVLYLRNCHNVHSNVVNKPAAPPKPPVKKINCTEMLKNGNRIDCRGLDRKGCTLRSWEYAAPECQGKTGAEAKKCADDRDVLPFGAGVFYTGYMRAAVPQYPLQKTDEPVFKELSCDKLNPFDCTGINKYMCQYRSWQAGGCIQAAKCKNDANREACCAKPDSDPSGFFKDTFLLEFKKKCMA
ncbi:hypothetical protein MHUMG1_09652 [Metarhizium humberi]|uniref:Uncharacterized protein n=1 Tax=Metarhizium humberi TaxID=2596975 RepID=A0A9P8M4A2_9HYPO|nr:hypothetical protein MHUMG1_09652 [Metarhizium humberi]